MEDSRPTRLEIMELVDQLNAFFPLCAMEICEFVGNSLELMQNLKPELRIKDLQATDVLNDIFSGKCPPSKVKVLGLLWDYVADTISFDFSNVEPAKIPITKMNMLGVLHTLYDPMGIPIQFFITGNFLIQDCWQMGLTWKDKTPKHMEEAWLKLQDQIPQLSNIKIARVLIPGESPELAQHQLHVFADASQDVYSAVAYMNNGDKKGVTLRFVQARSRLKPIKAALCLARRANNTSPKPATKLYENNQDLRRTKELNTTFGGR
jgi:hypothetical protein